MIATLKDMSIGMGGALQVTLSLPREHQAEIVKLKDEQLDITIKRFKAKRSRDANSLMWSLCRDIAQAMSMSKTPLTDRDIYKDAIQAVGEYVQMPIKDTAVDTFIQRWGDNGIGWVALVEDASKLKGYKRVRAYYGSSTYTTEQMSRLLDYLVDLAEQLNVPIMASKTELAEAKRRWGDG